MKRGLKKFKQKVEKAVTEELEHLHGRDAFWPVRSENPSEKQKHKPISLLMLLKEKRYGPIKGRGVAGGRK